MMNTILVYSDVLLDDLCALEYLSTQYKSIILIVINDKDLASSDYASDRVRSFNAVVSLTHKLFKSAVVHSANNKYTLSQEEVNSVCRVYSLAPMTAIVKDLKRYSGLRTKPITVMAGNNYGVGGAQGEWNASADEKSYNEFFSLAKRFEQFTWNDCIYLYNLRGIPFNSSFQEEYESKMRTLNDSTANFDLQTVIGRPGR